MADREHGVELRRSLRAPPARVWALVADTNRFDRAAGLTAGKYEWRVLREGDPTSRVQVATARQAGFEIVWIEPPYDWVEGRSVRGERTFVKGPLTRGGFAVQLEPDGDGTRLVARAYVAGEGVIAGLAGLYMKGRFRAALRRYVDAIEQVLTRDDAPVLLQADTLTEPPAVAAHRALMTVAPDVVTSGAVSMVNAGNFAHRCETFASAPVDAVVRGHLVDFLRTRPDEELGQMRPFEIARAWGDDRREVLRAFLHAARAGLVDLNWQLNCPTCRVGSEVADSLSKVQRTAHCAACNIDFALDFAEHVEAIFTVSPSVRKVETSVYCAASPWFRPHVFAQLVLPAGTTRTIEALIPPGELLFRTVAGRRRATFDSAERGVIPVSLAVNVTADAVSVTPLGSQPIGQSSKLTVTNATDVDTVLLVERSGWHADIVLGSVITSLTDFVDLFATEAPASGVELTIGTMTLLFSDLTGSTAMYERMGDARAFAVVQEHFGLMINAVTAHEGAVVKTMGDAVMATFTSPANALRAALAMVGATERAHASVGISVKIGMHEGPCLAVRANDRLDFFGTTVNVAARLQAQAHASEIVLMQDLLRHPDVGALVRDAHLPTRHFDAELKGIREAQHLIALRPATPDADA